MASLQSQLDEFKKFEVGALPYNAPGEAMEAILRATALVCVVLLLSSLGLAQKLVTARASIPFNFGHKARSLKLGTMSSTMLFQVHLRSAVKNQS